MKYEDIKFFSERCEEHPDHQSGMITNSMIQQRLHEEIDELREYIEKALKEKNMKSEQIKHSLSVGTKSIQSRVFDRETDEVISFVKIPIKDSGLVRCEWVGLTDEEEMQMYLDCRGMRELLDAIDAKLKQKNGYTEEKNTREQE
jgi:hypothetical protein